MCIYNGPLNLNVIRVIVTDQRFDNSRHVCPNDCGKSYKLLRDLRRHIKYDCGDLKLVKTMFCPYCQKPFTRKTNMKMHVAAIHKSIL